MSTTVANILQQDGQPYAIEYDPNEFAVLTRALRWIFNKSKKSYKVVPNTFMSLPDGRMYVEVAEWKPGCTIMAVKLNTELDGTDAAFWNNEIEKHGTPERAFQRMVCAYREHRAKVEDSAST